MDSKGGQLCTGVALNTALVNKTVSVAIIDMPKCHVQLFHLYDFTLSSSSLNSFFLIKTKQF